MDIPVIEYRNGQRTVHYEDAEHFDAEWDWLATQAQISVTTMQISTWAWRETVKTMSRVMEAQTMWMTDQKNRDERNVIHAAERFTTERRIETRRFSGMATRVIRRRPTDDGDGPKPAA